MIWDKNNPRPFLDWFCSHPSENDLVAALRAIPASDWMEAYAFLLAALNEAAPKIVDVQIIGSGKRTEPSLVIDNSEKMQELVRQSIDHDMRERVLRNEHERRRV